MRRRFTLSQTWRRIWVGIGIVVILLLIVNEFTSNPYAKYRAKVKLETYLNENYPESSFKVTNGRFERKENNYDFKVTNKFKTEETYAFEIENGDDYTILQDQIKENEYDEEASKRLSLEASNSLKSIVEMEVPSVKSVTVNLKVPKRTDGKSYAQWNPDFDTTNEVSGAKILMDVDVTGLNDKDMYAITTKIYSILQKQNINYSTTVVTGYKVAGDIGEKTWDYEYKMEFDKGKKPNVDRLVILS